jgi:hypothetical protein
MSIGHERSIRSPCAPQVEDADVGRAICVAVLRSIPLTAATQTDTGHMAYLRVTCKRIYLISQHIPTKDSQTIMLCVCVWGGGGKECHLAVWEGA